MKMYDRLRAMREDKELRQADIAALLHCSQVCYSRYEAGTRDIPTEALMLLAEYYHTSVDYLLGLTDETKPYKRKKQ